LAHRVLRLDPAAGGDVLLVVLEQCVREVEHLDDALVRDPVVDDPVLAAGSDEAAPAKTDEVGGDLRLGEPEPRDELADRQLALLAQQLEDAKSSRIAEAAEVFATRSLLAGASGSRNGASCAMCISSDIRGFKYNMGG
jgi:hypothetical protein